MNKPGRAVDQTIKAMLDELNIKLSNQSLGETFYSMIRANRESGRRKIVADRRTVNRPIVGVVAIRLRVMIVPVRRNRAVTVVG
jgi:hypothetical protein